MAQFEVRALKDGQWLTEYRSNDQNDAVLYAKNLYSSKHYRGIRVVQETFVEEQGVYKEKTVYRYMADEMTKKTGSEDQQSYAPRGGRRGPPAKAKKASFTKKVLMLLGIAILVFVGLKAGTFFV